MIISDCYRYVYLACPKTGSSTTADILHKHFKGQYVPRGAHKRSVPKEKKDYFVFSTVRNPYPRMVSFWWEDTSGKTKKRWSIDGTGRRKFIFTKNKMHGVKFYDWLEYIRVQTDRSIFCSQTKFFELVTLNHVVHLENFKEEFRQLPFVGKLPKFKIIGKAGESRSATGHYGDYRSYYEDSKVLKRLQELCSEDFTRFGYDPDAI